VPRGVRDDRCLVAVVMPAHRVHARNPLPAGSVTRVAGRLRPVRSNIRRVAKARPGVVPDRDEGRPVREQLERILSSTTFQQVDRLKRFLTFIVQEAIGGRKNELKEYVIGVQVFGKEESFDPRTDPIVRVQARRLRAKLVSYYRGEGRDDELIIDLPKGGYAPVFRRRETPVLLRRSIGGAFVSRNTVAILRFADHSVGRDLEYICRGVRDEIVHHLARLSS